MTATVRQLNRRPAKRPERRQVTVRVAEGAYAGWEATARVDFPASTLADLESGRIVRLIAALDVIVVEHNMPNAKDEVAERMGDVDPYEGLLEIGGLIFEAIAKFPKR